MKAYFGIKTKEDLANALASYLPPGIAFAASKVEGTNMRALLKGLAGTFVRVNEYLNQALEEQQAVDSEDVIEDWESALGIPDGCFDTMGSLSERANQVFVKLLAPTIHTADDMVELAAIMGFDVKIIAGVQAVTFPVEFPVLMFGTAKEARFTILVEYQEAGATGGFPYTFPITLDAGARESFECFLKRLAPANVNVITYFTS